MRRRYKELEILALLILMTAGIVLSGENAEAKKKKKVSLSKAVVTLSRKSYEYTGKERRPSVAVRLQGKRLKENRDYKVFYKHNIKVGTAKVTVRPKNKKKFQGKKTEPFRIYKAARKLIPGKASYSAVEGDKDFRITAKPSKGSGAVMYSCNSTDVIQVSRTGNVTVVDTGTATVKMKIAATSCYKAASASVKVSIARKPVRKVDADASIKNYNYPVMNYACANHTLLDFSWSVEEQFVIPGLAPTADGDLVRKYIQCNNLCPQGICLAGEYLLTTAYCMDEVHESCVFVYDRETGAFLNTIILTEKSHVGGITYDGGDTRDGNIWICHSKSNHLQRIPYSALKTYITGSKTCVDYKPDELVMSDKDGFHVVAKKPSAIAYNPKDGYLWVTEFLRREEGREAVMAAYEYKDGKLLEVSKYLHPAEEDYLGVITGELEEEERSAANVTGGAVVVSVVTEKESLEEMVLEEGDIITHVDEQPVDDPAALARLLGSRVEGEMIALRGIRMQEDGAVSRFSIRMELEERSVRPAVRTIPYCVQGVAFSQSGKAIFSRSRGRNVTKPNFISELMIFDATWNSGEMWDADEVWKEEMAVALPPMAEEVEMVGDKLYILFESSAMTYLEGTDGKGKSDAPIDKIISVDLKL